MCRDGEHSPNWNEQDWFFSLRLSRLRTVADLKEFVVRPAIALLSGQPPENALGSIPPDCLVRYRLHEESGQLEVIQ